MMPPGISVESELGTPRAEFLESVRRTLGRSQTPPWPPYPRLEEKLADLEGRAEEIRRRLARNGPGMVDQLADTAAQGGWNVYRAPGPEDAVDYIQSLATTVGANRIVRSDQEVFNQVPVEFALRNSGFALTTVARDDANSRESLRQEIIDSDMGITGVDYAVAETGSAIVIPRKGLSRLVSLVPPVHVALVRAQDVVESLDDLFTLRRLEFHRNGGEMGSYLNFITGPSRTADIEMTIVVGVHGPKVVHMVLLG